MAAPGRGCDRRRSAGRREHPGRAFARAGLGGPASFARKARRGAGHQRHVVEFAAGKPGVQPPATPLLQFIDIVAQLSEGNCACCDNAECMRRWLPLGGDGMTGSTWY